MALPSGTSISASQVNTYIGKSAGTLVSFNTTIRMLSNNNTSPNMNGIRGQSAFEIQWSTGQSSDIRGGYYLAGYNWSTSCTAHLIPGTPWRAILSQTYGFSVNYPILDLRIVGTNYAVTYRYTYTASSTLPNGYYLTGQMQSVMLDNGKLVIVGGYDTSVGGQGFRQGLYFIVLTFNSNGSIATTTQYNNAAYRINTSLYAYLGYNAQNYGAYPNLCPKLGNKFTFTMAYATAANTNNYQDWFITVDLSTTTLSLTFDQSGTVLATFNYGQASKLPILQSDGTLSVFYAYNVNISSYSYYSSLNSAGTAYTNGTRYTNSAVVYTVTPTNGGVNYNITVPAANLTTGQARGYWDSKNNFYWLGAVYAYQQQLQIAASPSAWYYSGTVGGLTIIKTNSTNTLKYQAQLSVDTYMYGTAVAGKSGTVYTIYSLFPYDSISVLAIDTDASDNTYVLYRTMFSGTGSYQGSSTAAVNPFSFPAPTTQQNVYNVTKLNSSGVAQWTVQLDVGPKTLGGIDSGTTIWSTAYDQVLNVNSMALSWSMLCNDSINALEIYCHIAPRDTSAAYYFLYQTTQRSFRSVSLRMSDGATSTYAPSSAANTSLITKYQLTAAGSNFNMYINNSATTSTIKLKAPRTATAATTTAAGAAFCSVQSARTTSSVSSVSTASLFSQNSTTFTLGTTFNTNPDSL